MSQMELDIQSWTLWNNLITPGYTSLRGAALYDPSCHILLIARSINHRFFLLLKSDGRDKFYYYDLIMSCKVTRVTRPWWNVLRIRAEFKWNDVMDDFVSPRLRPEEHKFYQE